MKPQFKTFALFLSFMTCMSCTLDFRANSSIKKIPPAQSEAECKTEILCESNEVCFKPQLDNCGEELNCKLMRTHGVMEAACRKTCDLANASTSPCPTGMRCTAVKDQPKGVCLPGTCSKDEECGTNTTLANKCLDVSNGPMSGLCALGCSPLRCSEKGCDECPEGLESCEPAASFEFFVCVPTGDQLAGAACNDASFCAPGNFCGEGVCRPFCAVNSQATKPSCPPNSKCHALYEKAEVGICK